MPAPRPPSPCSPTTPSPTPPPLRRVAVCLLITLACPAAAEPIKVGVIGLDTSHAPAFVKILNDPKPEPDVAGFRVVAAYPKGSPDIPSSVNRVPQYTKQVKELGV